MMRLDGKAALVSDGCLHHLQPQLGSCVQLGAMRRTAGRQKAHLREPELLPQLVSGAQMPAVNRIESPAEYADRGHAF